MKKLLVFLSWVCSLVPVIAIGLDRLPNQPDDGIYDPDGWLGESSRKELVKRITTVRDQERARVFVVILPSNSSVDQDQLAGAMGKKWGEDDLWAILLHVVDDPDSPKVYGAFKPGDDWSDEKTSSFQASVDKALSNISQRTRLLDDPRLDVTTAGCTMCDDFGYLGLMKAKINLTKVRKRGGADEANKDQESKTSSSKISTIILSILAALVLISVILILTLRKGEEQALEYRFPETLPRQRFLAPWSGGGNVLVDFSDRDSGE